MPKTVYVAVDPEGGEHTRTTDRTYTHAVLAYREASPTNPHVHVGWGVWGFAGRADLAEKAAGQARKVHRQVIVVPAVVSYAGLAAAAREAQGVA